VAPLVKKTPGQLRMPGSFWFKAVEGVSSDGPVILNSIQDLDPSTK